MAWEYKGITIEMRGEFFHAIAQGKRITKSSVAAIRKEIDRLESVKAEEQAAVMNLPVVILRESSSYSTPDKTQIFHGSITGLDLETRKVIGVEEPKGWRNSEILPDSPENTKRLEKLKAARSALKDAEHSIEGREVSLYIPSLPHNKLVPYGSAVSTILKYYEDAKNGKAD